MSSEPKVAQASCTFGADPEFFFTNTGGDIVGAEKVLPKNGVISTGGKYGLVLDGVQVEMNPRPSTCRQSFSSDVRNSFIQLKQHLNSHPEFKASFSSVVEIKKEELDSLGDKAKVFGCAPSLNVNGRGNEITVDAATYLKRAAGGHIHLGFDGYPHLMKDYVRSTLIPLLDIIVGNTCVMLDLDPEQKTRRLHYGRAGEYRLPKHGVEYRTLSNFWLRSYPLTSLVMGLARLAVSIWATDNPFPRPPKQDHWTDAEYNTVYPPTYYLTEEQLKTRPKLVDRLLERIDLKMIEKAINENDLELAKKNYYEGVVPFIQKYVSSGLIPSAGINKENLDDFDFFLAMIWEKGLSYWFPQEPMDHWTGPDPVHGGWESWCSSNVRTRRTTSKWVRPVKEVLPESKVEAGTIEASVAGGDGPGINQINPAVGSQAGPEKGSAAVSSGIEKPRRIIRRNPVRKAA